MDQETGCTTYPLNGINYSAEDAELYCCTRTSGVYSSDIDFAVYRSAETGHITVGPGIAWIHNTRYSGKVVRHYFTDVTELIKPSIVNDKLDRIVLRFDAGRNTSYVTVIEGEEAVNPEPPRVVRGGGVYDLGLAIIRVRADGTWKDGDLYSTILDESVCGIMRDGVTGIPTSDLQAQFDAMIKEMRETISKVEAGTDVMLQSLFNPEGRTGQVQFKGDISQAVYVDLRGLSPGDDVPDEIVQELSANRGKASIYAIRSAPSGDANIIYLSLQHYSEADLIWTFVGYYRNAWHYVEIAGHTLDDKTIYYNPIARTTDMARPVGVDSSGNLWSASSQWFYGTQLTGTGTSIAASVAGATTGDMYLNTTTGYLYKAIAPARWQYIMKLKGDNGKDGTSGSTTYIVVTRTGTSQMSSGAYNTIASALANKRVVVLHDKAGRYPYSDIYAKFNRVWLELDGNATYEFVGHAVSAPTQSGGSPHSPTIIYYEVSSDNTVRVFTYSVG